MAGTSRKGEMKKGFPESANRHGNRIWRARTFGADGGPLHTWPKAVHFTEKMVRANRIRPGQSGTIGELKSQGERY
jgi:hypothetical protein